MNCPNCKTDLIDGANFCSECGFDLNKKPGETNQQEAAVKPKVLYSGYLPVGGWINIIAGVILAVILFSKESSLNAEGNLAFLGVVSLASGILIAWLYFGLHKVILKVSRVEQALGIDDDEIEKK